MWNVVVGYLFARSVVGERAAKTGFLIVMICIIFVVLALALSSFGLFSSSFIKGVREGVRQWKHVSRGRLIIGERQG
jgi:thiol:disulfide interchange protein